MGIKGRTPYEIEVGQCKTERDKILRIVGNRIRQMIGLTAAVFYDEIDPAGKMKRVGDGFSGKVFRLVVREGKKFSDYWAPLVEVWMRENAEDSWGMRSLLLAPEGQTHCLFESKTLSLVSLPSKDGSRWPLVRGTAEVKEVSIRLRDGVGVSEFGSISLIEDCELVFPGWVHWARIGEGRELAVAFGNIQGLGSRDLKTIRMAIEKKSEA